jgi:hypothetical protein
MADQIERDEIDFAPIRKKLDEIKKRRAELPAGKTYRDERQKLNRQIRQMEDSLSQFGES